MAIVDTPNVSKRLTARIIDLLTQDTASEDRYSIGAALDALRDKLDTDVLRGTDFAALFDNPHWEMRWAAVSLVPSLGFLKTNEQEKLVGLLGDDDEDVREEVARRLKETFTEDVPYRLVRPVIKILRSKNSEARQVGVEVLCEATVRTVARQRVLDKLFRLLGDKDRDVRRSVVRALRQLAEGELREQIVTAIPALLDNSRNEVRAATIETVATLKMPVLTETVVDKLIKSLNVEGGPVAAAAAQALTTVDAEQARKKVAQALLVSAQGGDSGVRSAALRALGEVGRSGSSDQVVEALILRLSHSNERVQVAAADAVARLGENVATEKIVDKLERVAEGKSMLRRLRALPFVTPFGRSRSDDYPITLVHAVLVRALLSIGLVTETDRILHILGRMLDRSDVDMESRFVIVNALIRLGNAAAPDLACARLLRHGAVPALDFLFDEDDLTPDSSLADLGAQLSPNTVTSSVADGLIDDDHQVQVLRLQMVAGLDRNTVPAAIEARVRSALSEKDEQVRFAALKASEALWLDVSRADGLPSEITRSLLDDEDEIRDAAWTIVETYWKARGCWI